jgi:hypothetical protein
MLHQSSLTRENPRITATPTENNFQQVPVSRLRSPLAFGCVYPLGTIDSVFEVLKKFFIVLKIKVLVLTCCGKNLYSFEIG